MIFNNSQDPLQLWLYAERYLLGGTRTYSPTASINEMDTVWCADSNLHSFEMPCYWVESSPKDQFIDTSYPSHKSLTAFYTPTTDRFLLPLHPATLPLLAPSAQKRLKRYLRGPTLQVSPTASTRTLYVHGKTGADSCPSHFLKVHFPGRISRFTRPLVRRDVVRQLWVSEQLQKAGLPHLPDLGGGYAQIDEESSIGFLFRSLQVENAMTGAYFTLPGYSLYGHDKHTPDDPPLLAQIPYHFHESSKDFILGRIIAPAIELWVKTVKRLGIIPELHGQNSLFCFNLAGDKSSICLRDSDLFVDARIRRQFAVEGDFCPVKMLDDQSEHTPAQILSLCYDGFLVNHFLSRVAACAETWCGIPFSWCRNAAIDAFHAAGGDDLPFSQTIYYYDDRLRMGGQFALVENTTFTLWR